MRIRPYKPSDAPCLMSWLSEERTVAYWRADRFVWPVTKEQLQDYYKDFTLDPDACLFTALDEEGILCGHFSFRKINYRERKAHLGFIVTNPDCRGKGYGRQMVSLALAYAKSMLGVETVTLGVYDRNLPARHCYEALGFCRAEGMQHTTDFHGEQWTYFYMQADLSGGGREES